MNKYISILLTTAVLMTACNNNPYSEVSEKDTTKAGKSAVAVDNSDYDTAFVKLTASSTPMELLSQGWELEDDIESIANNDDPTGMIPFRSFYLSNDGTVVKNPRNTIEFGKWIYDADSRKITLSYSNGNKDIYKVSALALKELRLVNVKENSETVLKFVSSGSAYKNAAGNPWHTSNQSWRMRPSKSEDDAAIRKRLKDCISFYMLFYKDAIAKDTKMVSFYGLPTCIKWYAGGIYIVKQEALATNWIDCFYNEAQAFKAQAMMDEVIGKKYTWSKDKNKNWVEKNLLVLEQMYKNI